MEEEETKRTRERTQGRLPLSFDRSEARGTNEWKNNEGEKSRKKLPGEKDSGSGLRMATQNPERN